MRWDLSADLPADATGGAGAYPLALYGGTLAAYGLRQLEIDTDPTGTPTAVPGADAIIATLERTLAATGPGGAVAPPDSAARRALATIKANRWPSSACWRPKARRSRWRNPRRPRPSPSARVDRAGQRRHPGRSHRHRHDMAAGRLRPGQPARYLRAPGYDQDAFRQSQRATIDAMVATLGERAKSLTDAQWARIRDAESSAPCAS